MFAPVLKLVRALLCALALALIGAGAHATLRAETSASETEVNMGPLTRGKPAPAISARAGSACPLVLAVAQAGASRVAMPAAAAFVLFFVSGEVVSSASVTREAERQSRPRARAGVVRLLI
jgi:hypothetical protein